MSIVRMVLVLSALIFPLARPASAADPIADALTGAARQCDTKTVKALLATGADPNVQGKAGGSYTGEQVVAPVFAAALGNCIEALQVLIAAGADVNARAVGLRGWTPLMVASQSGFTAVVKLLLRAGADVTLKSSTGETAFAIAARTGKADLIPLLHVSPESTPRLVTSGQVDQVLLRNGDIMTGSVLTPSFTVRTSYATLTVSAAELRSVSFEGGALNIAVLTLRNGDRLSGILAPESVTIRLTAGQDAEVTKEKIKEIRMRER